MPAGVILHTNIYHICRRRHTPSYLCFLLLGVMRGGEEGGRNLRTAAPDGEGANRACPLLLSRGPVWKAEPAAIATVMIHPR